MNKLLAELSEDELTRLTPCLELVMLPRGLCVYQPGTVIQYVYFPTSASLSLLYEMDDGAMVEIGMVGKEGMLGVALFLSGESTVSRAVVQSTGYAYRLKGECLKREFHRAGLMQKILLRYTQVLITEIAQTLVCVRHHPLKQRLCRWLLTRFDRSNTNRLELSQESIASLLGVRRAAISEIAGNLRQAGLISYERGRITLLDQPGLEKLSCGCNATIKAERERLLPTANSSKAVMSEHDAELC